MKRSLKSLGVIRLAAISPELRVADVAFNTSAIMDAIDDVEQQGGRVAVFPEMAVSGYSCGDLFYQSRLLDDVRQAVDRIAERTGRTGTTVVLGAPIMCRGRLFNCAVFIAAGEIRGIVPKSYLPNTNEFYEKRWFASEFDRPVDVLDWSGREIPFGADLLFQVEGMPSALIGVEICEDLWAVEPPSGAMARAGATVFLNISASPEILGKQGYRRSLVQSQSARCLAAYLYASAGPGESTTDLVYAGHSLIAENGAILSETPRFDFATRLIVTDVDVQRLQNERLKNSSFSVASPGKGYRLVSFPLVDTEVATLRRPIPARPFVPSDEKERADRCHEIFAIQTTALARRLKHTGARKVTVGVSGGLDSTLALLVAVKAFDKLGLDRKGVVAVTMPGFGTTRRTRSNAEALVGLLGAELRSINIDAAVRQHFADIGHDEEQHDVVFENAQARERTQILMNVANQIGGFVVGTGDLSELALGWCTYNADHMSMYSVNTGVPKTLVRYLVEWCEECEFSGEVSRVLADICDTPVSPELLPPDSKGDIGQFTEEQVGPYLLHDFYLYYVVRLQFPPSKIFFLACQVFSDRFDRTTLLKWLKMFYRRFFAQQFKRSCLPDGPKVGSVVLSPRGDWRMPSDASSALWLAELEELEKEL
ncbi:MAG: NAD(+) synthase [Desulfuromonadales bacterium]